MKTLLFNRKQSTTRRRKLRKEMTRTEAFLWSALKGKQINGYKFRRQFGIDNYVVDFYCPELKLAVEVDGDVHGEVDQRHLDLRRQREIESFGIKFLRFSNSDVLTQIQDVLEEINRHTSPRPSLQRRGIGQRRAPLTATLITLFAISLFHYSTIPPLHAAFKDPGYGARPAGMGGAFTAVSDDANAVRFNPAGATQAAAAEVSFAYSKPFTGLDDVDVNLNFVTALMPVSDIGAVGIAWASMNGDVLQQNTASLLMATSMNRWFPDLGPALSVGANAHFLHQEYSLDARTSADSVFARGRSAAAAAFDVGLWLKPDPRALPGLSLGIAGKSLNEPDLGLADRDPAHREIAGGAAYVWRRLTMALDLSTRKGENSWNAGAETWLFGDRLALRAGTGQTAANAGLAFVLRLGSLNFVLDYAFSFPYTVEDSAGAHRAALGMKW
jgi:very-short-patch-repair endonuclease